MCSTGRNSPEFSVLVSHPVLFTPFSLLLQEIDQDLKRACQCEAVADLHDIGGPSSLHCVHLQLVRASVADAAMRQRPVRESSYVPAFGVHTATVLAPREAASSNGNLMMGHGSPMSPNLPSTSSLRPQMGLFHGMTVRMSGSFCILSFHHLMQCPSKMNW